MKFNNKYKHILINALLDDAYSFKNYCKEKQLKDNEIIILRYKILNWISRVK